MKLKLLQEHECKDKCSKCKGQCCKSQSCPVFPTDLEKVDKESIINLIGKGYCFDYWEGNPTDNIKYNGLIAYFIRPKHKNYEDRLIDATWGGECIFLTDEGCKLLESERPSGGKAVIPKEGFPNNCVVINGWNKKDCAVSWLEYHNIIKSAIKELNEK